MFFETSEKWKKLNKRLEEYDKLFGEQERKEQQELREWSKKFRQKNWISLEALAEGALGVETRRWKNNTRQKNY